jgi:prepilin-type N-terminal cleavage/methylation domain-containing protein
MRLMRAMTSPHSSTEGSAGFTIVEVIVALMVTSVGALGLAATSALVQRLSADAVHQTRAATVAQSRFERFRSLECAQIGSGTSSTDGLTERWQAIPIAPRLWLVTDSVSFHSGRRGAQAYRSLVEC